MIPAHDHPDRQAPARCAVATHPAAAAASTLPSARWRAPHRAGSGLHGRNHLQARTSTPWALLPARELGCGSATSCWRRLEEWAKAGVFEQLQALLLDELGAAGRIDLDRVSVDSFSLRAVKGGT
jgi:hypothetical protein